MFETKVQNPIIPGFNPDPNVLRVAGDYYIAVSSFEWLPGIRIYHSVDLVNWAFSNDILTNQVDLRGNPENGSIWAPQLSYSDQQFYCIYTDVKNAHGPFKDCHNYLITATNIKGPWSQPIYLNSSGFDPALFHDPKTNRKWLVNELWDYRMTTSNKSSGIVLQEYSDQKKQLIGPVTKIFDGTALAKTEAPQIYYHHDYYYLITAEGGTGKNHSVTVCRSRKITGPYELAPNSPILTASDKPNSPLQCSGHASLVKSKLGLWYLVYLTTRPLANKYHILGRETAIQQVKWTDDDWLTTMADGNGPESVTTIMTDKPIKQELNLDFQDDFCGSQLRPEWNTVRILAEPNWLELHADEGFLRMTSGESPASTFEHHLLAIRQNCFKFTAMTTVDFRPTTFNQMAGLLLYLNYHRFIYLYITYDEAMGRVLRLMVVNDEQYQLDSSKIQLPSSGSVKLRFVVKDLVAAAQYKIGTGTNWQVLTGNLNLDFLSGGFTGNFIGIGVHDMNQKAGISADFQDFKYMPIH